MIGFSPAVYDHYQRATEDLLVDPILGDDISVDESSIENIEDILLSEGSPRSIFCTEDAIAIQGLLSQSTNNNHQGENGKTSHRVKKHASKHFEKKSTTISILNRESLNRESLDWGEWDVPLGRAQEVREFVGNVRFRDIVDQHRPEYSLASRKSEKTAISSKVHFIVTMNGGRFLDKSKQSGSWFEISYEKALAKISQALRNGTRPVRRSMASEALESRNKIYRTSVYPVSTSICVSHGVPQRADGVVDPDVYYETNFALVSHSTVPWTADSDFILPTGDGFSDADIDEDMENELLDLINIL